MPTLSLLLNFLHLLQPLPSQRGAADSSGSGKQPSWGLAAASPSRGSGSPSRLPPPPPGLRGHSLCPLGVDGPSGSGPKAEPVNSEVTGLGRRLGKQSSRKRTQTPRTVRWSCSQGGRRSDGASPLRSLTHRTHSQPGQRGPFSVGLETVIPQGRPVTSGQISPRPPLHGV